MENIVNEFLSDNKETWLQWESSLHDDPEQIKRQKSAKSKELSPIEVRAFSGVFRGSKKNYEATLSNCTCPDFAIRKKPCKHMYRLANELGVFLLDGVTSDASIAEKKRIEDVMPIVLSLPDELQILYRDICYSCGNDNKTSMGYMLDNETAKIFIEKSLLCPVTDKSKLITHCYVNDIRRVLKTMTTEKLPHKRAEMFDYALHNFPAIELPLPSDKMCLELPDNISHLAMTIRKRIYDKFPAENTSYFLVD